MRIILAAGFIALIPINLSAQNIVLNTFKKAAVQEAKNPTTYAPAVLSFTAKKLDWKSSQVFFRHGYAEANSDFTLSGKPADTPISYAAGNKKIAVDSLKLMAGTAVNNLSANALETIFTSWFPDHRRSIKTAGWIERIAISSFVAYKKSNGHFRQWRMNNQLAREKGYK